MRRSVLLFLIPALPLTAEPVTLQVDPDNSTTVTYQTENGISVSNIITTGTIETDLQFDPVTRTPTEVTFTGGTLFYSDSESVYTPNSPPPVESLIITSSGNEGQLATLQPGSPIDPSTGILTNENHTTSLSKGTFNIEFDLIFLGNPTNIFSSTTDFAIEPQIAEFSGQTTLTSTLRRAGPIFDTYDVHLSTVSDSTPRDLRDLGLALTVTHEGRFSAIGSVQFPSAEFLEWSAQHVPGHEPPAILYALGFGPEQQQIPLAISPTSITLTLPSGGTRTPATIQQSFDLHTWNTIQTIPANTVSNLTIPAHPKEAGFFRLVVE